MQLEGEIKKVEDSALLERKVFGQMIHPVVDFMHFIFLVNEVSSMMTTFAVLPD